MSKEKLFGKTPSEIKTIVKELEMPAFTANQIIDWLYKKEITDIEQMSNISAKNRSLLSEKYQLGVSLPIKSQESKDGTKKYLYPAGEGRFIETAYIPDENRSTLCVSSQVGCKMGCLFCMTGKQGFQQQLTAGEIVNQIRSLPERDKITNIVYMGMGEPFDNPIELMKSLEIITSEWGLGMSPRRITVSSIGIIPAMKTFLDNSTCHLAISMHSPFEEERRQLMPIQHVYSIKDVVSLLKNYDWHGQRRISFEYIMLKGVNDTESHVREIARILNGLSCRINLIKFHAIPDTPLEASDKATMLSFRDALTAKGIFTSIRQSRGEDIFAACGLLSTKELIKNNG
ncbi:MAG: 23S rRNA (adenine(2503)-C(2))-methyltransferase RlmN [Bacteroidales bacterium]